MGVNRDYVDKVADMVRNTLGLQVPMTLDSLLAAVSGKLPGRCVPKSEQELGVDAQIVTLGEESFEIHFLEGRPDTRKLFSISHELGHLFLHLLEKDGLSLLPCNIVLSTMEVPLMTYVLLQTEIVKRKCKNILHY